MATWTNRLIRWPHAHTPHYEATGGLIAISPNWLFATHELVMGRPTLRLTRAMMATESEAEQALADRQLAALRSLIAFARASSPHYKRIGLPPPDSLKDLADMSILPMLTREDLCRHAAAMCVDRPRHRRLRDHSSGSTGAAVPYFWDRVRQAWDKANRMRGHAWHGFKTGDRELHLWPVDAPTTLGARFRATLRTRRDAVIGDLQIDSNDAASASTIWQRWRQFDPARVTAFPSRLCEFIIDARRQGCLLFSPSLRRVFLTGEVTHAWQKSLIERELGVETVQSYGVQEAGAIAFACEYGAWHTCAESIVVEFIREGRPATHGEFAEVVVTSLVNRTMPLIRYRTGDVVRVAPPSPCTCGRTLPVLPPVIGRIGDFVVTPEGRWIEPALMISRLADALQPGTFQLVQSESGRIEIHVVEGPRSRCDWREAAVARLTSLVGREAPITVRRVPRLPRCASGKMRYVQSQLSRHDAL